MQLYFDNLHYISSEAIIIHVLPVNQLKKHVKQSIATKIF